MDRGSTTDYLCKTYVYYVERSLSLCILKLVCDILFILFISYPRSDIEMDAHTEGSLAAEVSMVALDTLELIIQASTSLLACSIECDTNSLGYPLIH